MWDNTAHQCRQISSVGAKLSERLTEADLGGLRELSAADPRKIERVAQRSYPVRDKEKPSPDPHASELHSGSLLLLSPSLPVLPLPPASLLSCDNRCSNVCFRVQHTVWQPAAARGEEAASTARQPGGVGPAAPSPQDEEGDGCATP